MQAKSMHIVHLVAGLGSGGAEKQLFLLCAERSAGIRHSVVSVAGGVKWTARLKEAGVPVHSINAPRVGRVREIFRIALLLRRIRPTVLHCWLPSMNIIGAISALLTFRRCAVIASVRNVDGWMPVWRIRLQRLVARLWNLVLCNSYGGLDWCRSSGLPEEKLRVISNGVPPAAPRTRNERWEARSALGLAQDSFVVVCASRLVPQKRVDRTMEIARRLPDVEFAVAGNGPEMDRLHASSPPNVRFLGQMADTRPLLAAGDIFLMTSDREGTSNSLLEALQIGCAVVATPAGDNRKILAGGIGIVTEPESLVEAITALRNNPELRAVMEAKAVQRAGEFTVERMVHRTVDAYREITGSEASPNRARILYLDYTNNIGMGGGQRSLLLLLKHVDKVRYQPLVACPPDEQLLEFIEPGVGIRSLPLRGRFRALSRNRAGLVGMCAAGLSAIVAVRRLRQLLRLERVDLIHANNMKMLLLARAAALGGSVPIIWHVRDILPNTPVVRLVRSIAVRLADQVLAVSGAVAKQLGKRSNVEVVYNAVELPGLDDREHQRRMCRSRFGIPSDAFVVGYAGRLDPGKGLDVLVDAVLEVGEKRMGKVWLLVAGDGPERERVENRLKQAGFERNCVFTGFEQRLDEAWAAMDIAVIPSTEPDSFPRSAIEAMSHGVPAIGSNIGGIGEAIEHGTGGLCIPAGSREALASAIELLYDDRELAERMGKAGRARCMKLFTVTEQAAKVSEIYENLLSRGGRT